MTLLFDERSHTYTRNGVKVPGVTSVIGASMGDQFQFVDKDVLEAAADRGRRAHAMIELEQKGGLIVSQLDFDIVDYFDAWMEFRAVSGYEPILSEARVGDEANGYAGTLDLCGRINGKLCLPDVKCVTALSKTVGIQTAAYENAARKTYPEVFGLNKCPRFALQLRPGRRWNLVPVGKPSDLRVFLSMLTVYNFKQGAL